MTQVTEDTKPAAAPTKRGRAPADRKPKKTATPDVREVEVHGVKWVIPVEVMNDFELLDDLYELDKNEDPTRMPSVLRRMLGSQWGAAMDLLRDKATGRVTYEAGSSFVLELVNALNPNSSRSSG